MPNNMRVYDSDFVGHQQHELIELAREAALAYNGNWESLIFWKKRVVDGREIGPRLARQILNMCLATEGGDAVREALYESLNFLHAPPRLVVVTDNFKPKRVVNSDRRNRVIDVTTDVTVKARYGMSTAWNAVVHIIDHDKTHCRWGAKPLWPYGHGWDFTKRTPVLWAYWVCGNGVAGKPGKLLLLNDIPSDKHECRKCIEADGS